MNQHSTKHTNLKFLFLVLAIMAAGILWMVAATAEPAGAAQRPTPTPCEVVVEGILRCPSGFATSQARPGEKNVPQRAIPTAKRGK